MSSEYSAQDRDARLWARHLAASGEAGRRWLETYAPARAVEALTSRALHRLRRRETAAGRALLDDAARELETLEDRVPASVRAIADRWFQGSEAYYFYGVGELDRADAGMRAAHDAVARAVGLEPLLVPFAHHCHEFNLHRARIARNRRRWDTMWAQIELARERIEGRRPLCVLEDGGTVTMRELKDFYAALELAPEEREALRPFADDRLRRRIFERFVRGIYTLPDVVIPYP